MTNFQNMIKEVQAEVKARNLETIKQFNAILAANGYDVEVKIIKSDNGIDDCVAVYGNDEGFYVQASLDEHPEALIYKIRNRLNYFDIDVYKL